MDEQPVILDSPGPFVQGTMLSTHRAHVADEPAPKALKKYEILGPLAKGGMADLFLARAGGLGGFERLLVIKRILPELARDTEFVRMFLDEARTVATLHHSNIVHVYDVDMVDGSVFYAMEHLHGQHVASLLERARARGIRVPLETAISIAVSVAAGLHYAHERWGPDGTPLNIVHRDVAPNNVMVTYDGNVKVIDFGIAKSAKNLSNTRFGLFKGKLPYASPEQIRCEAVDRRTDVFSLGVLLYELTTGQQLFSAENEYELLRVMTEAIVPLPRLRDKSYPRELEAIVLKALSKERDDRHATAQALQRELEVYASKAQLDLSGFALSRFMARLFDDEVSVWQSARKAGVTLEQHIITHITGGWAVVEQEAEPPARPSTSLPVTQGDDRAAKRWQARWAIRGAGALALVLAGALGARWLAPSSAPATDPAPAIAPPSEPAAPPPAPEPEPEPTPIDPTATTAEPALPAVIEPPPAAADVADEPDPAIELERPKPKQRPKKTLKRTAPKPAPAVTPKAAPVDDDEEDPDSIVPRPKRRR
jgi:serine/threonine protein kinase